MASIAHFLTILAVSHFLLAIITSASSAQLSTTYYSSTCPNALPIIKSAVVSALTEEALMGADLLRLHFHDCFVNGCDASVLLDDTPTFKGEKSAPPNRGSLSGFDAIDSIKSRLEEACPGVVSCADILTVAARDSVVFLGGPDWEVALGRRDATTASLDAVSENIPFPSMDLSELVSAFADKGFSAKEMVALSGAHTIGHARCVNFRTRIYNESSIIDASFGRKRRETCPLSGGGDDNLAPLDDSSSTNFDNDYFKDLVEKKGLLHSDQELFNGGSTDAIVMAYASNISSFMTDFANAMIKMGNLSPLTGSQGQVRTDCRTVNNY